MRRYLAAFGFGMMLLLGACAGTDDPAAVIEAYVEAYNAGDADAIATLFAEDAVITGHPGGTFTGVSEIQALASSLTSSRVISGRKRFAIASSAAMPGIGSPWRKLRPASAARAGDGVLSRSRKSCS